MAGIATGSHGEGCYLELAAGSFVSVVLAPIHPIAFAVQAAVDAVALAVQSAINTIAFAVQLAIDAIALAV